MSSKPKVPTPMPTRTTYASGAAVCPETNSATALFDCQNILLQLMVCFIFQPDFREFEC